MKHILDGSVIWPYEICILGTGPNGVASYDRLKERPVIAVNKSILILKKLNIRPAWWIMSTDCYVSGDTSAFMEGADYCLEVYTPSAFSHHLARYCQTMLNVRIPQYWYQQIPRFKEYHIPPDPILSGASVSGTALQLGRLLGTKRISLVGVDMFGATQWNGESEENYPHDNHAHANWEELECLQGLMGPDVELWSESKLELRA